MRTQNNLVILTSSRNTETYGREPSLDEQQFCLQCDGFSQTATLTDLIIKGLMNILLSMFSH